MMSYKRILLIFVLSLLSTTAQAKTTELESGETSFLTAVDVIKTGHTIPTLKKSYDVRLKYRISKDALRKLANKIKSDDSVYYKRTFITYFLPEMKEGNGSWATTHFNPKLSVIIYGLSLEQVKKNNEWKKKLKTEKVQKNRIGFWWADWTKLSGPIQIDKIDGKFILKWRYSDGSSMTKELTRKKIKNGLLYSEKYGREDYLVRKDGVMEIRDNGKTFIIARSIQ